MTRRHARSEAFSLFAFQDIITSVTGVIILVTLLLAIELVQRVTVAAPTSAVETSTDRIVQLEKEIDSLRTAITSSDELVAQLATLPSGGFAQRESELKRTRDQLVKEVDQLEVEVKETEVQNEREMVSDDMSRLEDSVPSLQSMIPKLRTQLEALKKSHRVIYNSNPFDQKQAWLVDLSPEAIRVAEPGHTDHFLEFTASNPNDVGSQFINWAKQHSKATEYFVLLLRPKAIRLYVSVYQKLTANGFDTGVDLLETDASVMGTDQDGI
jgi:hypothetical protein